MPMKDGDTAIAEKHIDAFKLVVDQAFQRCDIQHLDRFCHRAFDLRDDGEEGRFRLTRCGIRGQNQVVVGVKDDLGGGDLNGAQCLPSACIDEILHERGKTMEYVFGAHGLLLSEKENSARAENGHRRDFDDVIWLRLR